MSSYPGPGLVVFLPIIVCVAVGVLVVAVCYCCCCCCCKKTVRPSQNVTTVIYPPSFQQPISGCQPSYPVYRPVPLCTHGGLPDPSSPPPSYLEATNPAVFHNNPGPPMFPHLSQPAGQPEVHQQLPYNPAFCPEIAC